MTQYEKPREQPLLAYISSGKITALLQTGNNWEALLQGDLCDPLVRVPLLTKYLLLQRGKAGLGEVAGLSYGSGQEQSVTRPGRDVENQERAQTLPSEKYQLESQ